MTSILKTEKENGGLQPIDPQRGNRRLTNLCSNSAFGIIGIQPTTSATTQSVSCFSSFVSLLVSWLRQFSKSLQGDLYYACNTQLAQFLEVKTPANNYCRPHGNINPNHAAWKRTGTEGTIHFPATTAQHADCCSPTTTATCGTRLCLLRAEVRRQQVHVDTSIRSLSFCDSLQAGRARDRILVDASIFRTCPDRPWGQYSLLYNGYRVSPRGEAAGSWSSSPTPSSAEVKEGVELYIYSPSGPSWPVLG